MKDTTIIDKLWHDYAMTMKINEAWTIAEIGLCRGSFTNGVKAAIKFINDSEEYEANQLRKEAINETT